jgi:hypothetical protein
MYCQMCAGEIGDTAAFCPSCGAQVAKVKSSSDAMNKAKAATGDAVEAFKLFATNPVGKMPVSFETLGEQRALGVGIVFAVVFDVCVLFGTYLSLPKWSRPDDIGGFLKIIVFGAVPFLSIVVASALARKIFSGSGSFGGDSFVAGACLLPFGILVLLLGIVGLGNFEIIGILATFAVSYGILILYTGCTRISKISDASSALAVPIILLLSGWLTKILFTAML